MEREEAVEREDELRNLVQAIGYSFLRVGKRLSECQLTRWHRLVGFDTFDQFVERRLQMSGRAGRYYARVYRCYVEKNECPVERLVQIGWTKLEKLLPVLEGKTQAENAKEFIQWFAFAETHTVKEVEVEILSRLSPEEKEKHGLRTAYTVPVTEGQRDVLNHALEMVKKQTGSEDSGTALEYLAADFLSGAREEEEETGEAPLVTRSFRLTPEQDLVVQKALFIIRSSRQESDPDALVRLCQFYLGTVKVAVGKAA